MNVNLNNLQSHPLAQKFSDLAYELEKLPGGPRQTTLIVRLSEIRAAAQDLLNDPAYQLSPAQQDTLRCLFFNGPTFDGDLPSKGGRDHLCENGYVSTHEGWNFLTETGIALALKLDMGRKKEAR